MVDTQVIWSNYIYDNKAMENMYNYLDCSFLCKNVEKGNACDLFTFEEHSCYFGKSGPVSYTHLTLPTNREV